MKLITKTLLAALSLLPLMGNTASAKEQIVVETENTALVLTVGDNGRLYQSYLGKRIANAGDYASLPLGLEAYLTHGMEDYYEPALHINRADGNPSTLLTYKSHSVTACKGGKETVIVLADPVYADEVALHFVAFEKENVLKARARPRAV